MDRRRGGSKSVIEMPFRAGHRRIAGEIRPYRQALCATFRKR